MFIRSADIAIILMVLGFVLPITLFSNENLEKGISGKIEHGGKGVPYVAVFIKGTTHGTTTNDKGDFFLPALSMDKITLAVQGMGYKTTYQEVIFHGGVMEVYIELEPDVLLLEQVTVSGSRVGLLRYLPGSASFIKTADLRQTIPVSGNEMLRNIAGVHVVEEEGAGLRTNIGIRGLDPDKSRNVLILEDGIPVALAPYGEPEMYFTPSIDRMSGVEVLKGNGSILFGPQTIGGVINYLTADPSQQAEGSISLRMGEFGFNNTMLGFGNTINNTGFQVNYQRKQAENLGPTRFVLHDFTSKLVAALSPVSQLNFKLSLYDENSNSTYVGITQPMYDAGGMDDLRIAPDDELHVRRYAASVSHKYKLGDGLQLTTTAFGYTTTRNWNRQDFTYNASASNLTGVVHGFDDVKDGAIYMRNSTGQRNRQFEVVGLEPRLSYRYRLAGITSKLDAGTRYLYEKAYEQRVDGTRAGVRSGNLRDDEIRWGHTLSAYMQNKLIFNEQLSLTLGLRNENIWYERQIMRANAKDTLIGNRSDVYALIPGAGINYNLNPSLGFFAGIHRGFAPPRTKDAISNSGEDLELEAEKSWNSELGLRYQMYGAQLELTAFMMDFSNQVIPVSESSGGAGAGYINGGATRHQGLEAALSLPFSALFPQGWQASFDMNTTWVRSEFSSDRYVLQKTTSVAGLQNVYANVKGNITPYAPEWTVATALSLELPFGLGVRLTANYVGKQYTDALNTEAVSEWFLKQAQDSQYTYTQATASGRIGALDPYWVANLSAWYNHSKSGLGLNVSVKNVFNERYIASRRPQGIRAGMPRFFSAGLSYNF